MQKAECRHAVDNAVPCTTDATIVCLFVENVGLNLQNEARIMNDSTADRTCFVFSSFFFSFVRIFALLSSLFPTQIRGHKVGFSPSAPPHCGSCLSFLWREEYYKALSSLADY